MEWAAGAATGLMIGVGDSPNNNEKKILKEKHLNHIGCYVNIITFPSYQHLTPRSYKFSKIYMHSILWDTK